MLFIKINHGFGKNLFIKFKFLIKFWIILQHFQDIGIKIEVFNTERGFITFFEIFVNQVEENGENFKICDISSRNKLLNSFTVHNSNLIIIGHQTRS